MSFFDNFDKFEAFFQCMAQVGSLKVRRIFVEHFDKSVKNYCPFVPPKFVLAVEIIDGIIFLKLFSNTKT